jgi:hypothetical protein
MKTVHTGIAGKLALILALALVAGGGAAASASAASPHYVMESAGPIDGPSGGTVTLENSANALQVKCKTTNGGKMWPGDIYTFYFHEVVINFSECTTNVGGTCTTAGSAAGVITTNNMNMTLFYIAKATREVGLVVNDKSSSEQLTLTTFACKVSGAEIKFTVRGTALAKVSPVNTKTTTFTMALTGSKGVPTLTEYEEESGKKATTKLEVEEGSGAWKAADLNFASLSFGQGGDSFAEIQA